MRLFNIICLSVGLIVEGDKGNNCVIGVIEFIINDICGLTRMSKITIVTIISM